MTRCLFLPGAGGSALFWQSVADRLPGAWPKHRFAWPGLGDEPHDPRVQSLDDLVGLVTAALDAADAPCDVLAQSMGGVVAIRACLARPGRVRRLVLTATSGGIDVGALGAEDWRPAYRAAYPQAAAWIMTARADHSAEIGTLDLPVLLLWGDADPISPVAVGERLCHLLPDARLVVIPGADHSFVETHAAQVAELVGEFLEAD
ncbi:alpha/beta fold hydrolase [Zavarzinia sp. CC-PAN008]|uniref:alpha/beta fold hydrolase n=1 Tax=Zavarzinia sp. CC-PAN008 TaxID=3243332 RepID=UPI003F7479EA